MRNRDKIGLVIDSTDIPQQVKLKIKECYTTEPDKNLKLLVVVNFNTVMVSKKIVQKIANLVKEDFDKEFYPHLKLRITKTSYERVLTKVEDVDPLEMTLWEPRSYGTVQPIDTKWNYAVLSAKIKKGSK